MKIIPTNQQTTSAVHNLKKSLSSSDYKSLNKFLYQINACPYTVYLMNNNPSGITQRIQSDHVDIGDLEQLQLAWLEILSLNQTQSKKQNLFWQKINNFGYPVLRNDGNIKNHFVYHFSKASKDTIFFMLLPEIYNNYLLLARFLYLANLWQIKQGNIPIHASGVIHQGKLFIFSGYSGAGKSTVAKLLESCGNKILDEDQLTIKWLENETLVGNAWGEKSEYQDIPVTAIFELTKSEENHLKRKNQSKLAFFLLEHILEVSSNNLPDELHKFIFTQAAKISRRAPGYELQFNKSVHFWNLITSELSLTQ